MARKRKFFLGCSWKSAGGSSKSEDEIKDLKRILDILNAVEMPIKHLDVVVSPPRNSLFQVQGLLDDSFEVACQSWVADPFTDEVSVDMLAHHNIPWVIIGQHQRRESDLSNEIVGKKVAAALSKDLNVIVYVGETFEQHQAKSTNDVIAMQTEAIKEAMKDKVSSSSWKNIVLAYYPGRANGTENVTLEEILKVHHDLREWLEQNVSAEAAKKTRIVYGGINGEECSEMVEDKDVDGFLVWGDSEVEFVGILNSLRIP